MELSHGVALWRYLLSFYSICYIISLIYNNLYGFMCVSINNSIGKSFLTAQYQSREIISEDEAANILLSMKGAPLTQEFINRLSEPKYDFNSLPLDLKQVIIGNLAPREQVRLWKLTVFKELGCEQLCQLAYRQEQVAALFYAAVIENRPKLMLAIASHCKPLSNGQCN